MHSILRFHNPNEQMPGCQRALPWSQQLWSDSAILGLVSSQRGVTNCCTSAKLIPGCSSRILAKITNMIYTVADDAGLPIGVSVTVEAVFIKHWHAACKCMRCSQCGQSRGGHHGLVHPMRWCSHCGDGWVSLSLQWWNGLTIAVAVTIVTVNCVSKMIISLSTAH